MTLGLVNQQGGPVSNPEFSVAAQAAADYINEEMDGVDGHPIRFATCYVISTEEQGRDCARQMLADDSVSLILQGGLNVGTQSFHDAVAGRKPVLIGQANPGPDTVAENSYAINASALASLHGVAPYVKKTLKAKTVAIVSDDDPANLAIAEIFRKTVEAEGIEVTYSTFPATSTDLAAPLVDADAGNADALLPVVVTASGCTAMTRAYRQLALKTPVIVSSLCITDQIKNTFGDYPEWIYSSSVLSLQAEDPTNQAAFYRAVMAAYAPGDAELEINARYGFASVFAAVQILNKVGYNDIAPESVGEAARDYTGPVLLGSPRLAFDTVPNCPTVGSLAVRFYRYLGNGSWEASGTWINAPG